MLQPTSCGPGPPLPPPPPPPPPSLGGHANNDVYPPRLEAEKRMKKHGKYVAPGQRQKSIAGEAKTEMKRTTKAAAASAAAEPLADNVLVEKSVAAQCVDDDDFSITTKAAAIKTTITKAAKTYRNCAAHIGRGEDNPNKNKNSWPILKLPMMLAAMMTTKTPPTPVAAGVTRKIDFEAKTAAEQIIAADKEAATVGVTITTTSATAIFVNSDSSNSATKVTTKTSTPTTKWLLMWLMLFGVMAQAPLHQVAAEKSKHYYMQALCKNHFLQQLYRKIDGAVLWSQNERNLDCIITFQTHSILQRFMLRFDMLQLDCNDHLYVYDGAHAVATPKVDISCRNTKQTVSSILTRTNFVTLKYVTDNWGTDANGFKLVITSVKDPKHTCNDFTCAAREFCISPDLLCDGINHCGDNSDESVCQSETAATVFGVDMTWFVLIVVGIVLVLSAVIVGISICVCRRQDETNLNQNTAIQMHHTAETNGSSKHLHYHHGGTLSREHTQLPPTSGNWHHPAGPYGYHRILRNLSKMATKVRPIWCLANSVN
ncbi:uncharacterized protein LOC129242870 [Anastrepha obliqua]|uniref:uncharacterized protein LOC129242870 n=1 Tax=Anastrepha obliqua TaxID=95512 RepID=UPI00240A922D|nr:uncharacterized protein LOC129242870 [Anastrepha obliqua]